MHESLIKRLIKERCKLVSIDLFSGPGGLCTGFKWAGILPLIAVEWMDETVQTYSKTHDAEIFELSEYVKDSKYIKKFESDNPKSLIIHGDINLVTSDMIKRLLLTRYGIDSETETVDIVSGGAPCESFSMAGQRKANDERDDLFSNILRIARTLRTKATLFENVKGLLSKKKDGIKGGIFQYILDSFEDSEASVTYNLASRDPKKIVLKAHEYGVPQKRERLFLVGIRSDLVNTLHYEYPIPMFGPRSPNNLPFVTVGDAFADLPLVGIKEESRSYFVNSSVIDKMSISGQWYRKVMRGLISDSDINAIAPDHLISNDLYSNTEPTKNIVIHNGLSSHVGPGHRKNKIERMKLIPEGSSMSKVFEELTKNGSIDKYRHIFPKVIYQSNCIRLSRSEISQTVTGHCEDSFIHPTLNRALTPREAARLQSFPDWYQFVGPYMNFHSDPIQNQYEQIGDAIPPLLGFALGKEFVKMMH